MPPHSLPLLLLLLAPLAWLPLGCRCSAPGAGATELPPEDAIAANARGAAALGQQEVERAIQEFGAAVEKHPGDPVLLANLALAEMQKGQFDEAERHLREALAADGGFLPAHFRLGVVLKNRGAVEEAVKEFEKVAETDPRDLATLYNLGSLRVRNGEVDRAIEDYEKALALDPTHVSVLYGMGRALIQKGEADKGSQFLARSQKIREELGMGETVGLQYGEQGKFSLASEYPATTLPAPPAIEVKFEIVKDALSPAFQYQPMAPALLDADGDGRVDLLLAGASTVALFLSNGDGTFRAAGALPPVPLTKPMPATSEAIQTAAGDLNNDGTVDLLLDQPALSRSLRLFRGAGGGRFEDVTSASGLPEDAAIGGELLSDVDHDGDLDIVLKDGDSLKVFLNSGDGHFKPREPIPLKSAGWTFLAASDFDNDRDVDIVGAGNGPRPTVFVLSNRRDGSYERLDAALEAPADLPASAALLLADFDKDGFMDLLLLGASSGAGKAFRILRNEGGRKLADDLDFAKVAASAAGEEASARGGAVVDFDNDGFLDVVLEVGGGQPGSAAASQPAGAPDSKTRLVLLRNLGAGKWEDATGRSGLGGIAPDALVNAKGIAVADLDGDGDLDLVVGSTLLRNIGGEKARWAEVSPKGVRDNRLGAGAKVEFRSGALWQRFEAGAAGLPVHMGLGPRDHLDDVRLLWPGGVLQDEVDVPVGKRQSVAQLDRKGTSCPILYAWDGSAVRFVTDFLGGCAIGYLEDAGPPPRWSVPDTDEYVKVAGSRLAARDGAWDLRMVNQLEEVIYFDRARLLVVDHPADTEVFPDERLMPAPPFPPFRIIQTRGAHAPVFAHDGEGRDLLDRLKAEDRSTVDGFRLLPFKGYAEEHDLVLGLGDLRAASQVVLLLDGWIDYADSTSNLAAAQAGLSLMPPRLDARRPGGEWRIVLPSMGFPAGLPKTMIVDLTGRLRPGESEVRVRTSMRIYWDRARVATEGSAKEPRVTRLEPARADLRFLGYPSEFSPDGRAPKAYDYSRIGLTAPWKAHTGAYTRFGDVRELLLRTDDRYVVTRPGDEIALSFASGATPALSRGWVRDFLLYVDGFGKDMDVNSARPDAVGPLPFHRMPSYPYPTEADPSASPSWQAWLDRWNTRVVLEDPLGIPGAAAPGAAVPGATRGAGGGSRAEAGTR